MKLITFEDIQGLGITAEQYYRWAVEMIEHKHLAVLPPKISLKPYDGVFCNVMPSFITRGGKDYEGVKVVTRYPDRSPALQSRLLLLDAQNGDMLALMDADIITAMRTGAVATHSIMLFAKKDYRTVAMMGLGNVARATLYMLLEMNPDRMLDVKLLRYGGEEELFAERFRTYPNVRFRFVDDPVSLVRGSDVVVSCVTWAPHDFCPDDAFDEGVLVVPVHTLGFTNCDFFFDKVYADDTGHVCHFKNFDKFRSFAEVSDVVTGKAPGRESERERILIYNIGISLHDVNYASHIYELLSDSGTLVDIDMQGPTEKYWV